MAPNLVVDRVRRLSLPTLAGILVILLLLTTVNLSTTAQSGCYSHGTAYVLGNMNIRQSPTTDSPVVATAGAGDSFSVSGSQQGDDWCWLSISAGWMAKTSRVSSAAPSDTDSSQGSLTTQSEPEPIEIDNCCFIGWQCSSDDEWDSGYWAHREDRCDSPTEWQAEWQQRIRLEQYAFIRFPERVIEKPGGVFVHQFEGGLELISRIPTLEEQCQVNPDYHPDCEDN